MPSDFLKRLCRELTLEQKDLLRATPTRGQGGKQKQDGKGQLRYELKRKGLLTTTRVVNGEFYCWRTQTGDDVVATLDVKPAPRVRKAPVQPVAA